MTQFITSCSNCDSLYQIKSDGNLICGDCGLILMTIHNSSNPQISKFNINEMLQSSKLNSWESFFLRNIENRKHLTLKQQEKFNQIFQKINRI